MSLTTMHKLARKNWTKVADEEFAAMDKEAQASWKELRERTH